MPADRLGLREFIKPGSDGTEDLLDRHAALKAARSIYRARIEQNPGRLIMLCDHARVLAVSPRQRPMPEKYP
jgi:hypothetical protein